MATEPLNVLGGRAEAMKETVAIYIEEGLNFKTTDQRVNVHQNTSATGSFASSS